MHPSWRLTVSISSRYLCLTTTASVLRTAILLGKQYLVILNMVYFSLSPSLFLSLSLSNSLFLPLSLFLPHSFFLSPLSLYLPLSSITICSMFSTALSLSWCSGVSPGSSISSAKLSSEGTNDAQRFKGFSSPSPRDSTGILPCCHKL